jgi:hypothetical protein
VLAGETSSQPLVHPHSRLRPSSACFLCCYPIPGRERCSHLDGLLGFRGAGSSTLSPPSQVGGRQRPTGMLPTSGGLCAADSCSVHQRGTWGERERAGHVLDDGSDLHGSPRQWAAPDNQLDESDRHTWREAQEKVELGLVSHVTLCCVTLCYQGVSHHRPVKIWRSGDPHSYLRCPCSSTRHLHLAIFCLLSSLFLPQPLDSCSIYSR